MTDEELEQLLASIGPDHGEPEAMDPKWAALTRGELRDDEADALRVKASADPSQRVLLEVFEPLEDDYITRTTDRLMNLRAQEPAPVTWSEEALEADIPETPAAPSTVEADAPGWFARLRELMSPAWMGGMVMAAVALLVIGQISTGPAPLPGYQVEVLGGDKVFRSADDKPGIEVPTLSDGSLLRIVLRPEAAPEGALHAAVFEVTGADWSAVAADVQVDEGGAVLVEGLVGDAFSATSGVHTLKVVVGPVSSTLDVTSVQAGQPGQAVFDAEYSVDEAL